MTQIDREHDPTVRAFLLLKAVQLAPRDIDSTHARRILREIPPDSPLWSLLWAGPENTLYQIARAANDSSAERDYAEAVVTAHSDTSVRAGFLYHLLYRAHHAGDLARAGRYYTQMTTEFGMTDVADMARKQFAPSRAIVRGNAAPDVAIQDVEDSTRVYRTPEFRGKYLLVDFWATWCVPCVAELRPLRNAYEKYQKQGLVLLSVSLDEKRDNLKRFRGPAWPVPWLSAFAPHGFASDAARAFEVAAVPRPILIDPTGRIVAIDDELRGDQLDRTLAKLFTGRVMSTPSRN